MISCRNSYWLVEVVVYKNILEIINLESLNTIIFDMFLSKVQEAINWLSLINFNRETIVQTLYELWLPRYGHVNV